MIPVAIAIWLTGAAVGALVGAAGMLALWRASDRAWRYPGTPDRRVLNALITVTERIRSFSEGFHG